jgi:two-component system OmpR family sensor kinase
MTYWVERKIEQKNRTIITEKYLRAAKTLIPILIKSDNHKLKDKLHEIGLKRVENFTRKGLTLYYQSLIYGKLIIFLHNNNLYLSITYLDETLTLYDTQQQESKQEEHIAYLFFILDAGLLLLIYILVLSIVSPLKHLSHIIKQFSNGNLKIRSKLKGKDEIAKLSSNFNSMADRLQQALNAKEELLREVGHELKTPIAKGKFALEKIQNSPSKEIIQEAFNELDTLTTTILEQKRIDEEKMQKEKFKASTLIMQALSKLTVNEEDIEINLEDFDILADLYYMSLALKNLIENGLKYSEKLPIKIKAFNGYIHIISYGKILDKPLEYYMQPFTRVSEIKKGFGLGLNITKKIIKKHGYTLSYLHNSGENDFMISFIAVSATKQQDQTDRKNKI